MCIRNINPNSADHLEVALPNDLVWVGQETECCNNKTIQSIGNKVLRWASLWKKEVNFYPSLTKSANNRDVNLAHRVLIEIEREARWVAFELFKVSNKIAGLKAKEIFLGHALKFLQ